MRASDPLLNAHLADPAIDDTLGWPPRVRRLVPNIDLQRWFLVAAVLVLIVTALVVSPPISIPEPLVNTPVLLDDATDFDGAALATSSRFEPNGGRFDPEFDYVLRSETGSTSVMVGAGQMALTITGESSTSVATMSFVGADSNVSPTPTGEGATLNYLFGDDPTTWQTGLTAAGAVEYTDVIGTSDLRYIAVDEGFRFDVQIEAGGDPDDVMIDVDGAELSMLETGDLQLRLPGGLSTVYSAPIAFQEIDGQRRDILAEFELVDSDTIGFSVDSYDTAHPLIIDPTIDFSTTIGGSDADVIEDVAVDNFGAIYIVGTTNSTDFPTTAGTYDQTSNGLNDVFVSHYAADGTTLLWSTHIGGSQNDEGIDLALARDGDVVVTGLTSSADFPTTLGAYDTTSNGGSDAFVLELSDDGTTLIASTYLGGSLAEVPTSLDIGRTGEIVVGGSAVSANFPTTGGAYDSTNPDAVRDGFVSSFSPALTALNWSTYVGASGDDYVNDVSIDPTGAVYLAFMASADMPTTAGAYDTTRTDGDAWIARLSTNGASLEYATYLGGSGDDEGVAILYEADDRVHVGSTARAGFPTTTGAFEETAQTAVDAAYTLLDPTATGSAQLVYSTFLGGLDSGPIYDIDLDTAGRVYLAGRDNAGGLATVNAPDPAHGGGGDGFLAVFDAAGVRQLHTYFGDGGDNYASGIAVDSSDRPVVVGPESASLTTNSFITRLTTLNVDTDGDGIWDHHEDADTDADSDPATNPGPDTDGDTTPNYLDADDDGDGTPTASENADPNGDGDPRDAHDSDRDGQPDYLDIEAAPSATPLVDQQKINNSSGGLTSTLQLNDNFGTGVAALGDIDGDGVNDVAIGAWQDGGSDTGAVYVLRLNADGTVKAETKINSTTAGLDNFDYFGASVAGIGDIDGDGIPDIAIGALLDDDAGGDAGAVYILLLNADGSVKAETKINDTTAGLSAGDHFGAGLAAVGDIDGDGIPDIAVGADHDGDGGPDAGAVYILLLNPDGTVKTDTKINSTTAGLDSGDRFGREVGAVGDINGDGVNDIAVGAPFDDDGVGSDTGAVYLLFLNADGTVAGEQKISATSSGLSGLGADYQFGTGVTGLGDIDGDNVPDIAVGALNVPGGGTARGGVFLLTLTASGTVKTQQQIGDNTGGFGSLNDNDILGFSVAGLGDLDNDGGLNLAITALYDDDGGGANDNYGAAYIVDLAVLVDTDGDGLWDNQEDANTDADNNPATTPGPDTDGDTFANYNDADDDGDGTPTASENADPNGDGDPRDAHDSDRDGQPDYLDEPTASSSGNVEDEQKISNLEGDLAPTTTLDTQDDFGAALSAIGDLDGDGVVDLAVGAPSDGDGGAGAGAVYVLFTNTDGTVRAQQKISELDGDLPTTLVAGDAFGSSVAGIGDIDGDGINDIAVGARTDDDGAVNAGAVYVLFMNANGTVRADQKISNSFGGLTATLDASDLFGAVLSGIGDLDGDGINDIAVGARLDDDGGSNRGAAYILFLYPDGTVKSEQKISDTVGGFNATLDDTDTFGASISPIGDLDADGIGDLAIGADGDDDGVSGAGALYVLFMNANGTVKNEQKISNSSGGLVAVLDDNDDFGKSGSGVGDLDGDGVGDLIVGAPGDDDGGTDKGAMYVLLLNADGTVKDERKISETVGGLDTSLTTFDEFGNSVAGLGDLDGDGIINVAVGAPGDDDGASGSGAAFVLDLAPLVDTDGDGLWDFREDADDDGDANASTNPGPDTDGDTFANYNDADDDGDGTPTASENADPNGDGDPRDALDSDRDGQPDYLDEPTIDTSLTVTSQIEISSGTNGGPVLDDDDRFGWSTASIGDINGDGIVDLAVGAPRDDDTGGAGNGTSDRRGAVYILFMNADGTAGSQHKISDASGDLSVALDQSDEFGIAVANIGDLDGDGINDLAVGAVGDDGGDAGQGALYILFLNADGTVRSDQRITEGEGGFSALLDGGDSFGRAITSLGDFDGDGIPDIAVGAIGDDDGAAFGNRGAFYLLMLNSNGTVKSEVKISEASGGFGTGLANGDSLGRSLAAIGDLDNDGVIDLAAGILSDSPANDTGAIYLIFLNADGTVKSKLRIDDTDLTNTLDGADYFGQSVAGLGDLDLDGNPDVAVGAFNDDEAVFDEGAVYILLLNSDGTIKTEQRIREGDGGFSGVLNGGDRFGASVASVGDFDSDGTIGLAVGADLNDDGGANRGSVWILDLQVNSCSVDTDTDGIFDCYEDADTDTDGDPATTPGPDTDGDTFANYNDTDDDGDGTPTASENADPNGDGDPRDAVDEDKDGEPDYLDIPAGTANPEATTLQKISDLDGGFTPALADNANLGRSVASLGDIDRDGINDLAVGAPGDESTDTGSVHFVPLNTDGSVRSGFEVRIDAASGEVASLDVGDRFGRAVAGIGDIDGDGINDLAVGAPGDDDEDPGSGAIYILFLNNDGTVKAEQKISDLAGSFGGVLLTSDGFGTSVSNLGDLDGDGINDLAVGAPGDDDEDPGSGAIYILFLNNDGTVKAEQKISDLAGDFTATLNSNDEFGISIANLGDVNGDGVTDIAVGALGDDTAGLSAGAVHILFLDSDGTVSVAGSTKIATNTAGFPFDLTLLNGLGSAVAGVGDLDDNGTPDVIVGAQSDLANGGSIPNGRGAVFIVYLDATGNAVRTGKIFNDVAPLLGEVDDADGFGSAVASMGDLDDDGAPGIAVGAFQDDDGTAVNNGTDRGAVYMLELVAVHTVNSTGDADDLSLSDGVCHTGVNNSEGDPECTLRAAITQANSSIDRADIDFDIPTSDGGHTSGVWRIQPATGLPSLATTMSIDASTQPGFTTSPIIELYGNGGAGDGFGLSSSGPASTIRGFSIGGFASNDLQLFGDDHVIAGNYLGFTADGVTTFPIATGGASVLFQSGNGVTIGGTTAADRNVIRSATWSINVSGTIGTSDLTISGNYIGVDATGNTANAGSTGIGIYSGATGVVVGGATPSSGNVIAATLAGVHINAEATDGNTVSNNSIGVAADGITATQGGLWSVWIEDGGDNTVISDNVIGNTTGQAVRVAGASTGTQITSNLIGIGTDGGSHPVTEAGIVVRDGATGTVVGGTSPADANTITNSAGDGVRIVGGDHTILGNSIYGNADLGIDHGDDGVTLPDSGDVDGVPNQPVLLGATEASGTTVVDLTVDAPVGTYVVQYFDNPSGASASGYGEGETLIASVPIEITSASPAVFRHVVPGTGLTISSTTTRDSTGGTSEFSNTIDGATAGALRIEDLSIRRSDFTMLGGAPVYVNGAAADALALDGIDDFLTGPGLDITDNALTLSASVFADTLSGDNAVISKRSSTGGIIYELGIDGATGEGVAAIDVTGTPIEVRGGSITTSTWHQIDAVWDGAAFTLYVDGVAVDTSPAVGTLNTDVVTRVAIGGRSDGSRKLDGAVDNVQIGHGSTTSARIGARQANLDGGGFITVGDEQTGVPGAWATSGVQTRSGSFSLSAPETTGPGSAGWAVARNIDEPGIVFESYWYLTQATNLDIASGTRATARQVDQYSGAAVGSSGSFELRQPSGGTYSVDASAVSTIPTGRWVPVEIWTDQLGDSRLFVDGVEVIGWTSQGSTLTSGSAGLLVNELPIGEAWYIDDARARRLVTPEPTTSLGGLDRN